MGLELAPLGVAPRYRCGAGRKRGPCPRAPAMGRLRRAAFSPTHPLLGKVGVAPPRPRFLAVALRALRTPRMPRVPAAQRDCGVRGSELPRMKADRDFASMARNARAPLDGPPGGVGVGAARV